MNDLSPRLLNTKDAALRARARAVVPGGMWGHQNVTNLPEGYPQFFSHAKGSRIWDVDGVEYVDFMCSWGPMILGYRHPAVEAAVQAQLADGDCMNGPGEKMVELAEAMVATIPHADWVQFQRNGTDATTFCVTLSRSATGKKKILQAVGAYHGALPWSLQALAGATSEDRANVIGYTYNDPASLQEAADTAGNDLAAIIVSAFKHDLATDQEMPTPEFARLARAICDKTGAALILDDVRAGFRLNLGGSWEVVGVRPDLAAYSKAIANGYALAAVTGVDRFREAATKTFSTGSFWTAAIPYAAGVATLKELHAIGAVAIMERMGTLLREGLHELSLKAGLPLRQTGPVQMPMVLFDNDPEFRKGNAFCAAALREGVYFHHKHNMFLSAAHTEDDIAIALKAAEKGFAAAAAVK